jgi:SAM-dependent methyltransferase
MTQLSIPICRLCGSSDAELIGDSVSGAPESAVYRCRSCSIVFLFPIMTADEEEKFYRAEFEKYMEGRAGSGWKSPEAHFQSFQPEGVRRLALVQPHLKSRDSVVEIGSSTGYFLEAIRPHVRAVKGVEPGEVYRGYAQSRGIETEPDISDLGDETFDVIALYYVLEHFRDPVAYLSELRRRFNSKGRLLIEVPNVEDALLSRYSIPTFPAFYWQKAHYHYFSRRTLADILERSGYAVQLYPTQRYDLSNHMVWMMEGKPGGTGRFRDLFSNEVEHAYAESLKKNWVCDTLFAVAELKGI